MSGSTYGGRYNGYANYQAWCVSLWIWNDERLYRFWQERAAADGLADELEKLGMVCREEIADFCRG